jgi:hypothetical protein
MAITSQDPRSSTPKTGLPFPLHRLNTPQTKVWLISPHGRNSMAVALARMYPGGVGVLSATQRLFAVVDPKGNVRELPPPHNRYEMWQIANAPRVPECPCANFLDPEVQGPWRERGGNAGHHPLCQFDRTAAHVFVKAAETANQRLERGGPAQERPDEWLRLRKEAQESGK